MPRILWCILLVFWSFILMATNEYKGGGHIKTIPDFERKSAIVNCNNAPIFLTYFNTTTTSVDLSWTSTNSPAETNWDVEIVEAGTPFSGLPTISNTNQNPLSVTSLNAGTRYCFRVRGQCGSTASAWSNTQVCFNTDIVNPSDCGIGFPIDDNNCGTGNDFPILVSGQNGTSLGTDIRLEEVRLIIDHVWEQDIRIRLSAPDGTSINLSTDHGGAMVNPPYGDFENTCSAYTSFRNNQFSCFNYPSIANGALTTFTGDFLPEVPFSNLNGSNPNGTWTLHICDDANANVGTLEYIELIFVETPCPEPNNVQFSAVSSNSAIVNWTAGTVGAMSQIEIIDSNNNSTFFSNATSPFTLTGLNSSEAYQLLIREECGSSIFSTSSCPQIFSTDCITFPMSESEDFDAQTLCSTSCTTTCDIFGLWSNATDNRANWTVHSGATPTQNTGPTEDVSGTGNYIYLETSNGTCNNKEAILESNCILVKSDQGDCHFSFNYLMFGNDVQGLTVELRQDQSLAWQPIWSAAGNQGRFWQKAYLDLSAYDQMVLQFRFRASSGSFDTGDIALDELVFYGPTDAGQPSFVHFADVDGDGFGDGGATYNSCSANPPIGFVSNDEDCNDTDFQVNPMASEIFCNQTDENCNGMADDSAIPAPQTINPAPICFGDSLLLQSNSTATGTFEWFDKSGNLLTIGNSFQSSALAQNDTFYIEDVITVNPGLRITETHLSFSNSAVELHNMGDAADYTGWKVVISDDNSNINNPVATSWNLGMFGADEIQSNDSNNWGETFSWLSLFKGWVLLIDDNDEIVDALFWNWSNTDILNFNLTYNGVNYLNNDLPWVGGGVNISFSCGQSVSMVGTFETNNASDFICTSPSIGTPNPNLDLAITCRSQSVPIVIEVNEKIEIASSTATLTCDNGKGDIFLTTTGGVGPYSYFWTDGNTNQNNIQIPYGNYNVTVTDSNGCTQTLVNPISLQAPTVAFQVQIIEHEDVSCFGFNDGMMKAEVVGGVPPYQFNWSAGFERDLTNPADSLMSLAGGMYDLTVTDGQGCVDTSNMVFLLEPLALNYSINVSNINCHNEDDAMLSVAASGGIGPYNYLWSNTETTDTIDGLSAGQYNATISDQNGCQLITDPTQVFEPQPLAIELLDKKDVSCLGANDGFIRLSITGGTPNYQYDWSGGVGQIFEENMQGLSGGNYQLTLTDANSCQVVSDTFFIAEADSLLQVDVTIDSVSCVGMHTGTIALDVNGGVAPYTYQWSNFESNSSINNLGVGTYFCTVIDDLGCHFITQALNVVSDETAAFDVQILAQHTPSCHNIDDGMIDIEISAGTPPYTYLWNNGQTSQDLIDVNGGQYRCTISDANTCQQVLGYIDLIEPSPLIIQSSFVVNDDMGTGQGSISINVSGGTSQYTYDWSDPLMQDSSVCLNLSQGVYTVTVTDQNSCSYVESFYVDGITSAEQATALKSWSLYPNPTQNHSILELELEQAQDLEIQLINILGQTIQTFEYHNQSRVRQMIDLANAPKGIYFVKIRVGNSQITEKLILE